MNTEAQEFRIKSVPEVAADARRAHRSFLKDVAMWSLKNGRGIDLDVIALIMASRVEYHHHTSPLLWTRVSVYSHLWGTAFNYCSIRGGMIPENVGEQMWILLDYLVATEQLEDGSDPLEVLREPLHCYWWLDRDGVTRTDDGPRYAPCRCREDYVAGAS